MNRSGGFERFWDGKLNPATRLTSPLSGSVPENLNFLGNKT